MKNLRTIITKLPALTLLLAALFSGLLFQACEEKEESRTPQISYIRITDPLKSDSLVNHAFMGSTIAIIGEDLGNVDEIWFNDQKAFVNLSFVTPTSIIVTIPDVIPATVTGKLTLINSDKVKKLEYDFGVDVPAPFVSSLLCEYVSDGETAVVKGNFFIDDPSSPLKVIFPGNMEGTITGSTINEINVTVPAGAGVGPISVKSIYGTTRSSFWFRDDRNIVMNFDDLTAAGGWRPGVIGSSNPAPVDGNYVRFSGTMAGEAGATWNEDAFSFNMWPIANGRPDVPFYTGEIADAVIKFECYVVAPWTAGALQMIFTSYSVTGTNSFIGDANVPRGLWIPWKDSGSYKTEGWTTATVPLSEFKYTPVGAISGTALTKEMLRGLTFFVWNGGLDGTDGAPHICIDNIRVVPK